MKKKKARARRKILIVDDSPINLILLQRILSRGGYRVIQAKDGEEAVQMAGAEQPDLIILDVVMPRVDGLEAACRLKDQSSTRSIPIIFTSATVKTIPRRAKKMIPGSTFLPKPIDRRALLKEIRERLENPQP